MSTTPAAKKIAQGFASFEARRAATYVKGRSGYDAGFLPRNTSPVRFPKRVATSVETAPVPKSPATSEERLSDYTQWKYDSSKRRQSYMANYINQRAESAPEKRAQDRKKMLLGRAKREQLLNAPISQAEQLSLPSIESTIADEYPLKDPDQAQRARAKVQNRSKKDKFVADSRLHQLLTLHHNSQTYVSSIEGLDALLESKIGMNQLVDLANKHTFKTHPNMSERRREIETDVYDQILGTAAGGEPGVLEVSRERHSTASTTTDTLDNSEKSG